MTQYSKRQFLKMVGLGIALSPFISLYSSCNSPSSEVDKAESDSEGTDTTTAPQEAEQTLPAVTEYDIILLKRTDENYDRYNKTFNGRFAKLPLYIAVCKTNLGVQHAIALAKKEQLPIAVKSGGHSFEGFSSNDGGLVINVAQMKNAEWLANQHITLEAGNVLQEVQSILFSKKRILPTGSCGTVGISGLTLGGGYGFFSRKYGLTCDQLIDATFIDGQGNIIQAKDKPELLWALKGGGNGNFGVVTSLTYATQPMPPKFYSHVLKFRKLDSVRFMQALETYFACTQNMQQEDFCAFVLNGATITVLATTFGDQNALAESIAPMIDIANEHKQQTRDLPVAMKNYYGRSGPILFKNASAGLYQSFEEIATLAPKIFEEVLRNKGMIYQINTLGGAIDDDNYEQNSCYPHRKLPYLSELQAYWDHKNQEAKLLEGFERVQQLVLQHGITAQYRNYPDINFQNWQEAYYGANFTKLQKIKQQYDPDNLFRYEQSVEA